MSFMEPPDCHHLNAALGWLDLGNAAEARAEWSRLSAENRDRPESLEVHWRICAAEKNWPVALELARQLVQIAPDSPIGWINQSYTLHEMKRTEEAWNELLPVAQKFPNVGIIPYNLACYACQLGQMNEAQEYLKIAVRLRGKEEVKRLARVDPDLKRMRASIEAL